MLLSDEEISDLWVTELDDRKTVTTFARAIEAAILAKLANAKLPEPAPYVPVYRPLYTADQLRQAYAQGAASQLAEKPKCWAIFTEDGNARMWSTFQPHVQKLADAEGLAVIELYTRKETSK